MTPLPPTPTALLSNSPFSAGLPPEGGERAHALGYAHSPSPTVLLLRLGRATCREALRSPAHMSPKASYRGLSLVLLATDRKVTATSARCSPGRMGAEKGASPRAPDLEGDSWLHRAAEPALRLPAGRQFIAGASRGARGSR